MTSRSDENRKRNRRIFAWSLAVAVLLHVAVFLVLPTFRAEPLPAEDTQGSDSAKVVGTPTHVRVVFGAPIIWDDDGTPRPEPSERRLEADRLLALPPECAELTRQRPSPASGRVQLRVGRLGHATVVALTESTGDECGDEVVRAVAEALRYHWLPNDRFPAPVNVVQPVTLVRVEN